MSMATHTSTRPVRQAQPTAPACPAEAQENDLGARRTAAVRPFTVMVVGLVLLGAAIATIPIRPTSAGPAARHRPEARPPAASAGDPGGITLAERDVSVVVQVYEPGHESGWHTHPGIHAVAVLSGTLTVYDGGCRATLVEPGSPYVGGRDLHLVRNESGAPVEMIVTYLSPSAPTDSTRHLPPPAGCPDPE